MGLFTKIFGTYSERELKNIYPIADKIEAMADEYAAMTDAQLQAKTPEFKQRLADGETLTTFCPRRSPPSARRQSASSASTPTACSSSAALCCTRAASPR